jgi:hypothetical protein
VGNGQWAMGGARKVKVNARESQCTGGEEYAYGSSEWTTETRTQEFNFALRHVLLQASYLITHAQDLSAEIDSNLAFFRKVTS